MRTIICIVVFATGTSVFAFWVQVGLMNRLVPGPVITGYDSPGARATPTCWFGDPSTMDREICSNAAAQRQTYAEALAAEQQQLDQCQVAESGGQANSAHFDECQRIANQALASFVRQRAQQSLVLGASAGGDRCANTRHPDNCDY